MYTHIFQDQKKSKIWNIVSQVTLPHYTDEMAGSEMNFLLIGGQHQMRSAFHTPSTVFLLFCPSSCLAFFLLSLLSRGESFVDYSMALEGESNLPFCSLIFFVLLQPKGRVHLCPNLAAAAPPELLLSVAGRCTGYLWGRKASNPAPWGTGGCQGALHTLMWG